MCHLVWQRWACGNVVRATEDDEPCLLYYGGLRDTTPGTGNCIGISYKTVDFYQDCGQWYMNPCRLCQRAGYRPEATNAGPEQTTQAAAARTEPSPGLTAPLNTNTRESLQQTDLPDQWPLAKPGPGVVSGDKRTQWQGMTTYVALPMTMPAHRASMNVMTGGKGATHLYRGNMGSKKDLLSSIAGHGSAQQPSGEEKDKDQNVDEQEIVVKGTRAPDGREAASVRIESRFPQDTPSNLTSTGVEVAGPNSARVGYKQTCRVEKLDEMFQRLPPLSAGLKSRLAPYISIPSPLPPTPTEPAETHPSETCDQLSLGPPEAMLRSRYRPGVNPHNCSNPQRPSCDLPNQSLRGRKGTKHRNMATQSRSTGAMELQGEGRSSSLLAPSAGNEDEVNLSKQDTPGRKRELQQPTTAASPKVSRPPHNKDDVQVLSSLRDTQQLPNQHPVAPFDLGKLSKSPAPLGPATESPSTKLSLKGLELDELLLEEAFVDMDSFNPPRLDTQAEWDELYRKFEAPLPDILRR